jgi:FkbM family methyltransferase
MSDIEAMKIEIVEHDAYGLNELRTKFPDIQEIWDLGANVGVFSNFAASLWPDARILAIEPTEATFFKLRENTKNNPNILPAQYAIGDGTSFFKLIKLLGDDRPGSYMYAEAEWNKDESLQRSVNLTQLKNLLCINPPIKRLIKIDIEGGERYLLTAENLSELRNSDIVIGELHLSDKVDGFVNEDFCNKFVESLDIFQFREVKDTYAEELFRLKTFTFHIQPPEGGKNTQNGTQETLNPPNAPKTPPDPHFIFTGCCSYNEKLVDRWVSSIRKYHENKIVLFLNKDKPELKEELQKKYKNLEVLWCKEGEESWKKQEMYYLQWKYFIKIADEYPDWYICRTDVHDVVFQDSILKYTKDVDKNTLFIADEGMRICDNPCQTNWMNNGDYDKNENVINSGTIFCHSKILKEIGEAILSRKYNALMEQGEYNFWLQKECKYKKIFNPELFLCLHAQKHEVKNGQILGPSGRLAAVCHANGPDKSGLSSGGELKNYITAVVCTRGRYHTTLPMTLTAIATQTLTPNEIIIYDDNEKREDLRFLDHYKLIFSLFERKGIVWKVLFGGGNGQVRCHQNSLEVVRGEFIWRIDDDEIPEPNVLESLFHLMENPKVGAAAGLVLIPNAPEMKLPDNINGDITNISQSIQWYKFDLIKNVDHLHSTFLYRKSATKHGYCMELSKIGHSEETIFTHEMRRAGWELLVDPHIKTWHLRTGGGIRSENDGKLWEHDEQIYKNKLISWGNTKLIENEKLVFLFCGLGDNFMFLRVLPKIIEKYKKVAIATEFPDLYKKFTGCRKIDMAEGQIICQHRGFHPDSLNIYKYCIDHSWQGHLSEAFAAMYGVDYVEVDKC